MLNCELLHYIQFIIDIAFFEKLKSKVVLAISFAQTIPVL